MANNSVVTQEVLQNTIERYHEDFVYPYQNGATHTGCVPLGTILPYFGETAPTHFLICDGTEYAKADYPELAEHLLALTDPSPYVVSGDNTKFKVPDLRGEFLRGTGTNSHTNQGNGANVGVHQNATESMGLNEWGTYMLTELKDPYRADGNNNVTKNMDTVIAEGDVRRYLELPAGSFMTQSDATNKARYTSRPTNTSVLYCVAYKNIYIDLALDSFPLGISNPTDGQLLMYDATAGRWVNGGHKYSTDEHVVGTWIDGKPVYEVSFSFSVDVSSIVDGTTSYFNILYSNLGISTNIDNIIDLTGLINNSSTFEHYWKSNNTDYFLSLTNQIENSQFVYSRNRASSGYDIIKGTIRYTKTTDTV